MTQHNTTQHHTPFNKKASPAENTGLIAKLRDGLDGGQPHVISGLIEEAFEVIRIQTNSKAVKMELVSFDHGELRGYPKVKYDQKTDMDEEAKDPNEITFLTVLTTIMHGQPEYILNVDGEYIFPNEYDVNIQEFAHKLADYLENPTPVHQAILSYDKEKVREAAYKKWEEADELQGKEDEAEGQMMGMPQDVRQFNL